MRELQNFKSLSPRTWQVTKSRVETQRTFGETEIMRKQWKISAQKLFTLSALGIITGFSASSIVLTNLANAADSTKAGNIIASAKPSLENKPEDSKALAESMKVHIEFLADPSISATDLTPSIKNGTMVIKGNVNNNAIAENAIALASRLTTLKVASEVKSWPFPSIKPSKVPVETLQAGANKVATTELLIAYPKVSVSVSPDGSIIATGPVVTLEDKLEISKRLRKIPGCLRVVNKIVVQPMRMGNETVTMVNKDGTKWILGKDQVLASTPTTESKPNSKPAPAIEITTALASSKPATQVAPVIVPTQNTIQPPITKETPINGNVNQKPKVLPESLTPVVPIAKPLAVPEKPVDILVAPKTPAVWDLAGKADKKEPVKPSESAVKEIPAKEKSKTVAKPVDAKTTSITKEKNEAFPTFPDLNKKDATPTTLPTIQKELPSAKQPEKVKPAKESPKVAEKAAIVIPKATVTTTVPKAMMEATAKSEARVFMPAHDPQGSALVKTDMLGFPVVRREAPPEIKQPVLSDKIPARYATNSDKDPEYNRPYLAVKTQTKPVPTEKMLTEKMGIGVASKPAMKQDKMADSKSELATKGQPLVKKDPVSIAPLAKNPAQIAKAEVPAKTASTSKGEIPAKTVSNDKSIKSPQSTASRKSPAPTVPGVASGSISFDDGEDSKTPSTIQQKSLVTLKKQVEQVCGKKAASVQVIEKPDGSRVLLIDIAQGSKQEELAKTLFSMPEITENNVSIEFLIK